MSNDSAFPSHGSMGEVVSPGMSLRDYFAAKAMQGLIACPTTKMGLNLEQTAYKIADDMLKERDKL